MTAEEKERSDAAWATVVENMKLVRFFARRFPVGESDEEDLVQAGAIGFYVAAMRHDPALGLALSTYCKHRIFQHLRRSADSRRIVKVPRHAARLAARVARGEVDELGLSPEDARTVAHASAAMADVVGESSEGGARAIRSVAAAEDVPPCDRDELRLAVESLPQVDREVIRLRFFEGMILDEVATAIGITREGARQREVKALRRLRWKLDPESRGKDVTVGRHREKHELAPDADLSALTPREREVVRLRVIEGRKLADVAATLGCSDNNVSQVAKRAMRKLQARKAS